MKKYTNMKTIQEYIDDPNVLNIYRFGSHVYGTNDENSDEDYIVILKKYVKSDSIDIHHHTVKNFQSLINDHDIQALECFFAKGRHILKNKTQFHFKLDKTKLRHSISRISDGSWIKGKKKLIIAADYNKRLAIKSVFHSLRIRKLGIQIAQEEHIYSFHESNYIYWDLLKITKDLEGHECWEAIENKYRSEYKRLRSGFIELCPKEDYNNEKCKRIREVLESRGIEVDKSLIKEIISCI